MTTAVTETQIWPRLAKLAECLCSAISDRGLPEPCVCTVMPGLNVAFDYCTPCSADKCGMAWVRMGATYPSTVFPVPDTVPSGCRTLLAFEAEMGVARCAPVGDDQGNPPHPQLMAETAELQVSDMMAMRAAAECCFGKEQFLLGQYAPFGPEGGCVGGVWPLAVAVLPMGAANGRNSPHKSL